MSTSRNASISYFESLNFIAYTIFCTYKQFIKLMNFTYSSREIERECSHIKLGHTKFYSKIYDNMRHFYQIIIKNK